MAEPLYILATQLGAGDEAVIPGASNLLRVLTLQDYNTRLVVISVTILGVASGLIGSFMLLRKRALLGDALSHATLPGIALAFIIMAALGGSGKYLPGLLAGAAAFGLIGVACVVIIRDFTRLKDDTALGVVLSVFFGLGVALLGIAQDMPGGSAAGLESFIYGKTASMVRSDLMLIAGAATLMALVTLLLHKELALLCFDAEFALAQGWPTRVLDGLMMTLVTIVTVIGLQAVGLILIIAMLIIPPAAARFWTERLPWMIAGAALIGAASGWVGATLSALAPRLPAGAIIVVVAASIFIISMIFGIERGVLVRALAMRALNARVHRQHLFRAIFEIVEDADPTTALAPLDELQRARTWSPALLRRLIRWATREGLVERPETNTTSTAGALRLTRKGWMESARVARNHRLWEMYLITHADIAPSHVDRDADEIEHILGADMVGRLERALAAETTGHAAPPSPHALRRAGVVSGPDRGKGAGASTT